MALGGCNRALAKVYRWQQALNPDEVRPVHGLTMRSEEAFLIMRQLLEADRQTRAGIRGITKVRADVIVGVFYHSSLLSGNYQLTRLVLVIVG